MLQPHQDSDRQITTVTIRANHLLTSQGQGETFSGSTPHGMDDTQAPPLPDPTTKGRVPGHHHEDKVRANPSNEFNKATMQKPQLLGITNKGQT